MEATSAQCSSATSALSSTEFEVKLRLPDEGFVHALRNNGSVEFDTLAKRLLKAVSNIIDEIQRDRRWSVIPTVMVRNFSVGRFSYSLNAYVEVVAKVE